MRVSSFLKAHTRPSLKRKALQQQQQQQQQSECESEQGKFVLKAGLIESLEQKYVQKSPHTIMLAEQKKENKKLKMENQKLKELIQVQQEKLMEFMEDSTESPTGHIYLMKANPLAYKNGARDTFPFEWMPRDFNAFKISITAKDVLSRTNHQTNIPNELVIVYQSEIQFENYQLCKQLFKDKYASYATEGGTDWFIHDIHKAKTELEKIIQENSNQPVDLIKFKA